MNKDANLLTIGRRPEAEATAASRRLGRRLARALTVAAPAFRRVAALVAYQLPRRLRLVASPSPAHQHPRHRLHPAIQLTSGRARLAPTSIGPKRTNAINVLRLGKNLILPKCFIYSSNLFTPTDPQSRSSCN